MILIVGTISVLAAPKVVFLDVGDTFITFESKRITLQNVGESGTILVDVDGVRETISSSLTKIINGVEITNDNTFYTNEVSERSASIIINFPDDCFDEVKNQDETDIDCGGSICGSCNVGMICLEDNDCLDGFCYKDECIKCKKFIKPECSNGKLISKGEEKGCNLGYTCCGDGICSEFEDENSCIVDCEPEVVVYANEEEENNTFDKEICYDKDRDGLLGGNCFEDCDDNDASVNNYAIEILDGKDNNCNSQIDEGFERKENINSDLSKYDEENEEEIGFFNNVLSKLLNWLH